MRGIAYRQCLLEKTENTRWRCCCQEFCIRQWHSLAGHNSRCFAKGPEGLLVHPGLYLWFAALSGVHGLHRAERSFDTWTEWAFLFSSLLGRHVQRHCAARMVWARQAPAAIHPVGLWCRVSWWSRWRWVPSTVLQAGCILAKRGLMVFSQWFHTNSFQDPAWNIDRFRNCEVWPPERSDSFETSVLCWSFADQSFWRGKSGVAMSEVASTARVIASTRFREAHCYKLWVINCYYSCIPSLM